MRRRGAAGASEVERYLDDMFDRLARTGGAGRRALAETEDHLRAAVADAMARGLPAGQAEHEAVARFGPPGRIARQLRRAGRGGRLDQALSSAWLLAGMALAGLGVSYLAVAMRTVVSEWGHPDCRVFLAQNCGFGFPVTRHVAGTGAVILMLGIVLLLGRWLMTRLAGLAASAGHSAVLAAVWCAIAGAGSYAATAVPGTAGRLGVFELANLTTPLIACGLAVTAAAVGATWSLTSSGRPRQLR